ncbi:FecR family protein [Mucilaginibacter mallensis]|uniref:FecR family protein n=1 Tax=Mucilaginibacter mallensis TaxID=652787 RepID=A0A1H1PLE6_MUCMA|nr:FecR family protein [Mucilaginibacter mallensis]SDS12058.1 FecR family protein [Mucilaginibacter mallensis]
MPDNNYCKVDDFLLDDSFVEWVLGGTPELNSYWDNFLSTKPECEENFSQARSIILSLKIKPVKELSQQQVDELIAGVIARQQAAQSAKIVALPQRKPKRDIRFRYAAVIAMFISLCWLGYNAHKTKKHVNAPVAFVQTYHQVTNNGSAPMLVKLPDNSTIILKPNAQLRYPNTFTGNKREVYLNGEAFFEVSKNKAKPFFVYSNELTVRVVGTSFVVKADKADKQFKIIVSTGRVEVFTSVKKGDAASNKQAIVLTPNQQGILYRNEERLEKANLKKPLLLSKESTSLHFNFVGTPFSKVISTLDEAYGVNIIYNEKVMANCQLTASLIDQPLDERLKLICKAVEADYKIIDGQIIIDGKGCN